MSLIKVIYLKSPVWIQNIMCSLQGWIIQKRRYSKSFFEELPVVMKGFIINQKSV